MNSLQFNKISNDSQNYKRVANYLITCVFKKENYELFKTLAYLAWKSHSHFLNLN